MLLKFNNNKKPQRTIYSFPNGVSILRLILKRMSLPTLFVFPKVAFTHDVTKAKKCENANVAENHLLSKVFQDYRLSIFIICPCFGQIGEAFRSTMVHITVFGGRVILYVAKKESLPPHNRTTSTGSNDYISNLQFRISDQSRVAFH